MTVDASFDALIQRVRQGDPEAAAAIVREYEPEIRRAVRMRLTDPRLHRVLDSVDVCQSVLGNFFVRAAAGQFELERPEQLVKLLMTMARNKLLDQVRRQRAGRRDQRRLEAGGDQALELAADGQPSPSRVVAGKELLSQVYAQLPEEERRIAELRAAGCEWAEIAREQGGSPEALRKRLGRALDRVVHDLGLEEIAPG
jgi:RNA polymerase sigma-70 factor (ECF subfamily)